MELRQSDLATMLDIHTLTLNAWENGHFTPHVRFVPRIVVFLEYDPLGPPPATFPLQFKSARLHALPGRRRGPLDRGVHEAAAGSVEALVGVTS